MGVIFTCLPIGWDPHQRSHRPPGADAVPFIIDGALVRCAGTQTYLGKREAELLEVQGRKLSCTRDSRRRGRKTLVWAAVNLTSIDHNQLFSNLSIASSRPLIGKRFLF